MSRLSISDRTFLEAVLGMQNGFVLDFSNASFRNFFGELDVDIYDNDEYPSEHFSGSKAYRMRTFWKSGSDLEVSLALQHIADYIDAKRLTGSLRVSETQINKVREISEKLKHLENNKDQIGELVRQTSTATIHSDQIQVKIRSEIYQHIKPYLETKDYFHSIEEAYKVVRKKLEEITGHEKASDVFNMNAENSKYHEQVFGYEATKGSPQADFLRGVGYLQLAVQFLRNEKSHELAAAVDKNLALHYISLASLAYDLITRAEVS